MKLSTQYLVCSDESAHPADHRVGPVGVQPRSEYYNVLESRPDPIPQ